MKAMFKAQRRSRADVASTQYTSPAYNNIQRNQGSAVLNDSALSVAKGLAIHSIHNQAMAHIRTTGDCVQAQSAVCQLRRRNNTPMTMLAASLPARETMSNQGNKRQATRLMRSSHGADINTIGERTAGLRTFISTRNRLLDWLFYHFRV